MVHRDILIRLRELVDRALALADENSLHPIGISLDTARLQIVELLQHAPEASDTDEQSSCAKA